MLENYMLDNTKIKIYDNYIVDDIDTQKKYINNIVLNLLKESLKNNK